MYCVAKLRISSCIDGKKSDIFHFRNTFVQFVAEFRF